MPTSDSFYLILLIISFIISFITIFTSYKNKLKKNFIAGIILSTITGGFLILILFLTIFDK
ncbi:hypothetical protein CN601_18760 [Bacillus sp. AFS017336]|nr:hypothetical protein CN692_07270 [Bacillus sp. AFS002410]PEL07737.1 hypothetical protein CN601_18760 [Bacillus sp. AFS017336]